ncbi:hypothetical protein Tco_0926731, partial [Tanacetum coccineum]
LGAVDGLDGTERGYQGRGLSQTYLAYSTSAAKFKKAMKWKQPTSAPKKESFHTTDDNIISDDPQRLVTEKSIGKRKPTGIVIKDTNAMTKKKTPVQAQKHKGMEMLSEAASLEEAQTRKALKISRRETSFRHQTGAGSKPEVPDVSKVMSSDQESKNKSWGESEDDNDDRQSDDERTESDNDKSVDLNKTDDDIK